MTACEVRQTQLLDYLYDLLEADERASFESHLTTCTPCTDALAQARQQQNLFASAAKMAFPEVRFEPPAIVLRLPERPAKAASTAGRNWRPWSIAASIFLAVGLLLGGSYGLGRNARHAGVLRAESQLTSLTADWNRLNEPIQAKYDEVVKLASHRDELATQRKRQGEELEKGFHDREVYLSLTGPRRLAAGAPNEFAIQTLRPNGEPFNANVKARLIDERTPGKERVIPVDQEAVGKLRLRLPPDVELKPDASLCLALEATTPDGRKVELLERFEAAGPALVTHLATDKPIYQPGEVLSFRSLTLDRFTLKAPEFAPEEELRLIYALSDSSGKEIWSAEGVGLAFDPKTKNPVMGPDKKPIKGLGAFSFPIPPDFPGGEYVVSVREAANRFPAQSRKIIVHRYEKPRLRKELTFAKKSFGPGDELVATCQVTATEGGKPVAGLSALAKLTIDGKTYDASGNESSRGIPVPIDATGAGVLRCKLPSAMAKGDASLSIQFKDGGNVETLLRPVPIVVNKLDVEFFPEGGELVAGLPNRVYFQARTPLGKPAELTGAVVDEHGQEVARLQTLNDINNPGVNQGHGKFTFTPKAGSKYSLKVASPAGIETKYEFPVVKQEGVVLATPAGVGATLDNVPVELRATTEADYLVGLYCRGRLIDHQTTRVKPGSATRIDLKPHPQIGGVYRVTVFSFVVGGMHLPVAERLVYRAPTRTVNVQIASQQPVHQPGDKATLTLKATDEQGQPTPAFVMVSVVDKSVLTLADERTYRSMPTHLLLTSEVGRPDDLEFADFLLTEHPLAREALDLLLGTQGWRRFTEQRLPELRAQPDEDTRRLLASLGDGIKTISNAEALRTAYANDVAPQLKQLNQGTERELASLTQQLRKAADEHANLEQSLAGVLGAIRNQHDEMRTALRTHRNRLEEYDSLWAYYVGWGLGMLLLSLGLGALLYKMLRHLRTLAPQPAYGYASLVVTGCVGLGTWALLVRQPEIGPVVDQIGPLSWGRPHVPNLGPAVADGARNQGPQPAHDDGPIKPAARGGPNQAHKPSLPVNQVLPDRAWPERSGLNNQGKPSERFKLAQRDLVERSRLGGRDRDQQKPVKDVIGPLENIQPQPFPPGGRVEPTPVPDPRERRDVVLPGLPPSPEPLFRDPPPAPYYVREFAHQRTPAQAGVREDFTETLYWHPLLVLPDGTGQISFDLCDSNTTFQATVYAHTVDGRLGVARHAFSSALAFNVEPKLPIELTATDRLDLPVTVTNATQEAREVAVHVQARNGQLVGAGQQTMNLKPESRGRATFGVKPAVKSGLVEIAVRGQAGALKDEVVRSIPVVPEGFPITGSKSDLLEKALETTVTLPPSWIPGTLKLEAEVFPSTLADLEKGLEALLREPHGCFEQTSSSNYPNLLILDYLRETNQANPAVAARARQMLAKGYQKLTSFECRNPSAANAKEGYDWFGGVVPAHEALTAYGLMQFRDMARVHPVDQPMVERTRKWLLSRRDGHGGFERNPKSLDGFGRAPDDVTNAYVVWALTEGSKDDEVAKELNALKAQATTSKDPYFLALVANALLNRDQSEEAAKLLAKLASLQAPDGHVHGAATTITGSAGRDLEVETTALALLAWLKANRPDDQGNVQKGVHWLGQQRTGQGGFGATQATVLALKALLAHARAHKKTAEAGNLRLIVNQQVTASLHFPAGAQQTLALAVEAAERHLVPGRNEVRVEITGNNAFPCTLSWSYQTTQPVSAQDCPMRLRTRLNRAAADEGDTVRLTATVGNVSGRGQGMTIAILGLPAGLSLPEDVKQLQDYVRSVSPLEGGTTGGFISAWETRGREVILYWRDFAPNAEVEVNLDLICRVPGEFTGPASRAYVYYNADAKSWAEPLKVAITAK